MSDFPPSLSQQAGPCVPSTYLRTYVNARSSVLCLYASEQVVHCIGGAANQTSQPSFARNSFLRFLTASYDTGTPLQEEEEEEAY